MDIMTGITVFTIYTCNNLLYEPYRAALLRATHSPNAAAHNKRAQREHVAMHAI